MEFTSEEIVRALRRCATGEGNGCASCSILPQKNEKYGMIIGCAETLQLAAADRLEVLEARQRWIPVTERLPEDRFEVLVYTDRYGGRHEFAYYIPRLGAWYQNCALLIPNVTHWTPLPEPPKECDDRE